jgi:hypothetical protein
MFSTFIKFYLLAFYFFIVLFILLSFSFLRVDEQLFYLVLFSFLFLPVPFLFTFSTSWVYEWLGLSHFIPLGVFTLVSVWWCRWYEERLGLFFFYTSYFFNFVVYWSYPSGGVLCGCVDVLLIWVLSLSSLLSYIIFFPFLLSRSSFGGNLNFFSIGR